MQILPLIKVRILDVADDDAHCSYKDELIGRTGQAEIRDERNEQSGGFYSCTILLDELHDGSKTRNFFSVKLEVLNDE